MISNKSEIIAMIAFEEIFYCLKFNANTKVMLILAERWSTKA